ncbi:hypothetical protein ACTD5D_19300 [Nocardia takedensis]|uniref:hypothetical protein n=1 Tax=Nocardia takedensis TaxID=259390 RepID=UPI003F76248A
MGDEVDLLIGGPPIANSTSVEQAFEVGWSRSGQSDSDEFAQPAVDADAFFHLRRGTDAYRRFERLGDPASLNNATGEFANAVHEAVRSSSSRYELIALSYLAACKVRRYEFFHEYKSLAESVDLFRSALKISDVAAPTFWLTSNLASSLHRLYRARRDYRLLEESVQTYRRAIANVDEIDKPKLWVNYCRSLVQCYDDLGDSTRLDEAHELLSSAQRVTAHPVQVIIIVDLCGVKLRKYGLSGEIVYLDNSIDLYEAALSSDVRIDYSWVRTNLGSALRARFDRSGSPEYLDRAIEIFESAVEATGPSDIVMATRVSALCHALERRSLRDKDKRFAATDLDRAISLMRMVVAACPEGHADKPQILTSLGRVLFRRSQVDNETGRAFVEEAIDVLRTAEALSHDSALHRDISFYLGMSLISLGGDVQEIGVNYLIEASYATGVDDRLREEIVQALRKVDLDDGLPNSLFSDLSTASIEVSLRPQSNEPAHRLSSQAMYLQQYLRSLDTGAVYAALDTEPAPFLNAEDIPEAGVLIVAVRDRQYIRDLVALLRSWASRHSRDIEVRLTNSGTKISLDIAGDSSEGRVASVDLRFAG